MMSLLPLALMLLLFLAAAMAGAWTVARKAGKEGWTDATWSFASGAAGAVGALLAGGGSARSLLVAAMVGAWGLRLGSHIAARNLKDAADPRYAALKKEWGASADRRLFLFLEVQALCGWVLAMAAVLAARAPGDALTPLDFSGLAIFLVALIGESVADAQMAAFRRDPSNKGRIAETGLWRWSRHPNYFFEWLGWFAYPLIAIGNGAALGWAALAAPAMMYWLLVHASGIPPLEKAMLASRGDAYRDYQRRVRAFFPFPK